MDIQCLLIHYNQSQCTAHVACIYHNHRLSDILLLLILCFCWVEWDFDKNPGCSPHFWEVMTSSGIFHGCFITNCTDWGLPADFCYYIISANLLFFLKQVFGSLCWEKLHQRREGGHARTSYDTECELQPTLLIYILMSYLSDICCYIWVLGLEVDIFKHQIKPPRTASNGA